MLVSNRTGGEVMSKTAVPQNRTAGSGTFWAMRREASLNWLALGLLLAAWNSTDRNTADHDGSTAARRRPEALRGYSYVSVRAASRVADISR
jgi:hypothetical protein